MQTFHLIRHNEEIKSLFEYNIKSIPDQKEIGGLDKDYFETYGFEDINKIVEYQNEYAKLTEKERDEEDGKVYSSKVNRDELITNLKKLNEVY